MRLQGSRTKHRGVWSYFPPRGGEEIRPGKRNPTFKEKEESKEKGGKVKKGKKGSRQRVK